MNVPTYDLFCGSNSQDAMWVEAVEGFGCAYKRMEELAADNPGAYFIYFTKDNRVVANIDTSM